MTKHAQSRTYKRCPNIKFGSMVKAVKTYFDEGYHEQIDFIMNSDAGGIILRYHEGDNIAYPIMSPDDGSTITVYDHEMASRQKHDAKFKKKMRRKKEWWGK